MTVVEIGVGIGVAGVTGGGIIIVVASAVVPLVLHSYSHHPPTIAYQTGGGWGGRHSKLGHEYTKPPLTEDFFGPNSLGCFWRWDIHRHQLWKHNWNSFQLAFQKSWVMTFGRLYTEIVWIHIYVCKYIYMYVNVCKYKKNIYIYIWEGKCLQHSNLATASSIYAVHLQIESVVFPTHIFFSQI